MSIRFLNSRTTLGVRDVSASIDFYAKTLGFETFVTMGEPPNFALIGHGKAGLGLSETEDPKVADFACCYFTVEGVEELRQRRRRCHDHRPAHPPAMGNYDFVFADPDGHQLAFGDVAAEAGD